MKRPPNRKALLATLVLVVAAALGFAAPAGGVPEPTFFKQLLGPGGF